MGTLKILLVAVVCTGTVALTAACGSSQPAPSVPSVASAGSGHASAGPSSSRVAALHAAAQCIRTHGIPSYQDPVLNADGVVYTDQRSVQDFEQAADSNSGSKGDPNSALDSIRAACGTLMTAAGFQPDDEAPAPPALVQAGVKAAQCLRAHGMPNYRDPSSSTPFTPGHGFLMTADEMPNNGAGGKQDPTFQTASAACRSLLDAEIAASTLTSLAHG